MQNIAEGFDSETNPDSVRFLWLSFRRGVEMIFLCDSNKQILMSRLEIKGLGKSTNCRSANPKTAHNILNDLEISVMH
jgi:hypothetical protein